MINSVSIKVIPHKEQRYDTLGDYFMVDDELVIRVSDCGNWIYNLAIGIHELIEAAICHARGISFEEITDFDIEYEKNRPAGNMDEPGDDPRAPYHLEHGFASSAERMLIAACGENWKEYEDTEFALLGDNDI